MRSVSSAPSWVDQVAGDDVAAVQSLDQAPQHHRLAGADLAGDDDEALVARDAVLEVGLGAPVLLAREVELRVGVELEGLAAQPVEGLVHDRQKSTRMRPISSVSR
jgi:hypothetical protein